MHARIAMGLLALLPACIAQPRIMTPYCAPPDAAAVRRVAAGPPLPEGSSRDAQLASVIGLSDALAARARGPLSSELRLHVLTRLELARLDVAAMTAELDCDGERTQQAADYLERQQSSRQQSITVASIVTAAAAGVASVLLATSNASAPVQAGVGISGAAAAAGLGFATLYVKPSLHFEQGRNLLEEIWSGPADSRIYPPIVWAYLSRPEFSNAQDRSIRSKIVERFCQYSGRCDDARAVRSVFGAGGDFDADTLRTRAALLDQIKAEVDLQNQDLKALAGVLLQ